MIDGNPMMQRSFPRASKYLSSDANVLNMNRISVVFGQALSVVNSGSSNWCSVMVRRIRSQGCAGAVSRDPTAFTGVFEIFVAGVFSDFFVRMPPVFLKICKALTTAYDGNIVSGLNKVHSKGAADGSGADYGDFFSFPRS